MTFKIPLFKVRMNPNTAYFVSEVLESGHIAQGPKVDAFERELAEYLEVPAEHIVTVNSGTSALHLAYHLAGIKPGDVVIATPMTCAATITPLVHLGAEIVWADVDPFTGNIEPESVAEIMRLQKAGGPVRAVAAVDWAGVPAPYGLLRNVVPHHIPIIEDAAHAFGARTHSDPSSTIVLDGINTNRFVCFPPRTPVMTEDGWQSISSIRVGQRVMTSTGYQPVLETHRTMYAGQTIHIVVGQARLVCTPEHPIRVHRDGADRWLAAGDVRSGDAVYVITKQCERCHNRRVPYYGRVCAQCFEVANSSHQKRSKIQAARRRTIPREVSRLNHHYNHVMPWMEQYERDGYRVIPLIGAIPDFIAMRDGQLFAIEVESGTSVRLGKLRKYDALGRYVYDDVIWITRPKDRDVAPRYQYELVETSCGVLARATVSKTKRSKGRKQHVYNLTIANDPTYFARGILVHNCFSFQAIKHLTTGDGGALICPTLELAERARRLRWFGLDRRSSKDFRCAQDITEAGYKFHMNDIAAAIGIANINLAKDSVRRHRQIAEQYFVAFSIGATFPRITPPMFKSWGSYWLYTILVEDRTGFQRYMTEQGIETSQVHRRNDEHSAFPNRSPVSLSGLDHFSAHQVSIPCNWWMTDPDVEYVIDAVRSWAQV